MNLAEALVIVENECEDYALEKEERAADLDLPDLRGEASRLREAVAVLKQHYAVIL